MKTTHSFRLSKEQKRALIAFARARGISPGAAVRLALFAAGIIEQRNGAGEGLQ